MKNHFYRYVAIALLAFALLLVTACGTPEASDGGQQGPAPMGTQTPSSDNTEPSGNTQQPGSTAFSAPDFEVLDKDGHRVKLSDFHGKPILLNFWATWCPPCKAEMPDLQEAYEAYGEEICFVMVNLTDGSRDTVDIVKNFVAANGYTFPVYFDTQSSAAIAYRVSSIPATYLISAEGEIVKSKTGMMTASEIESAMKLLTE